MDSPAPGQCLLPAPNGTILISLGPGTRLRFSASPPEMNRSGLNSSGSLHTLGSLPITSALNMKRATVPLGGVGIPAAAAPSGPTSRMSIGSGGWSRRVSRTTARRFRDEMCHCPLDDCHDSLCAGTEELPDELDDLVVPKPTGGFVAALAGVVEVAWDTNVEERVEVGASHAAAIIVASTTSRQPS
nr:unnamed protein product [Digitaria exilis]